MNRSMPGLMYGVGMIFAGIIVFTMTGVAFANESDVTFSRDVAPILQQKCKIT